MLIRNFANLEKDSWYFLHIKKELNKGSDIYLVQFSELGNGNGIDLISCNYGINTVSPHLSKVSFETDDFEMAYIATEGDILEYYPEAFVPLRMYYELILKIEELREEIDKRFGYMNDELRYMNRNRD